VPGAAGFAGSGVQRQISPWSGRSRGSGVHVSVGSAGGYFFGVYFARIAACVHA
jgi:hypothetical protein